MSDTAGAIHPAIPAAAPPRPAHRSWQRRLFLLPVLLALAGAVLLGERGCAVRSAPVLPKKAAKKKPSVYPGKWSLAWGAESGGTAMELDAKGNYRWGGEGWYWVGSYGWREDSRTFLVSERQASGTEWVTWWVQLDKDGWGKTHSDTPWANGVSVRVTAGLPQQGGRVEVTD